MSKIVNVLFLVLMLFLASGINSASLRQYKTTGCNFEGSECCLHSKKGFYCQDGFSCSRAKRPYKCTK